MLRVPWPATPLQAAQHIPLLAAPSVASYATLPLLYETYQAAAPPDKLGPFLALLLTKRLTLYACALATVYVAAMRSGDAAAGLGQRLELVTAEAVYPATIPEDQTAEVRAVAKQLDETPAAAQAAGLPLLFAALLASAYVSSVLLQPGTAPPTETAPPPAVAELLRASFSALQPFSTASTCFFAVNAEVQAGARALAGAVATATTATAATATDAGDAPGQTDVAVGVAAAGVALACVASAYLIAPSVAWPVQNTVNACVAIGVARVLQVAARRVPIARCVAEAGTRCI